VLVAEPDLCHEALGRAEPVLHVDDDERRSPSEVQHHVPPFPVAVTTKSSSFASPSDGAGASAGRAPSTSHGTAGTLRAPAAGSSSRSTKPRAVRCGSRI